MKLSDQSLKPILAIAIVGGLVFSFLPIYPGIAFALGAICTAFILPLIPTQSSSAEPNITQASKTLYVGNLPYRANESEVKKLFSEHGEVFAVRLMKDKRTGKRRGFGFVVMSSNDADNAIAQLNDKEYGQRTLKVREANEPKAGETEES
ncbi:RNA recognition motif domain-containing protein [Photobacterium sp. DNB23_23_1]|uniref:RNA-binding protein n=1 Tax=Photobacterium pectinilyticum TaxID=2906793 RepID=A0ABT1MZP5_9GAMM|nr:RNA-binding protein [Photobacterium sp. ZSDE20]MCQ1057953.1 RNA-binding protein [Photobacterium sp. ZSDE20]MDD1822485.1 RNA-binding protein [Photobacterium sp. ZSDE20]